VTRRSIGVAAAAAVLLAACGASAKSTHVERSAAPAGPRSSASAPRANHTITLAFAGDTHFYGASARALHGFGAIAAYLKKPDLMMVNLETAVTTRGTPEPKQYTFRSPPSSFRALRRAGIDVVTMANNHGEDYGLVGLRDSLRYKNEAHYPVVGIGKDEKHAFHAFHTTIDGQRVAVIGATDVLDSNLREKWTARPGKPGLASAYLVHRLQRAVREARADNDIVVVFLHWGTELEACPTSAQYDLTKALRHAGADIIVGSHAHVLLGSGWKGKTFVDYGLGNFVFYSASGKTAVTGILTLDVRRHQVLRYHWQPAIVDDGVAQPVTGDQAKEMRHRWRVLRHCTGLSPHPPA
jgi:poly-gamma-glutamate capsule biosynthesis protein CapA/YwtB (metallophosphatase superfamily)